MPEEKRMRTKQARLPEDLADKLAEVVEAEGTTSAQFLEPLIRNEIENRHKANLSAIKAFRAARSRAQELRDELPAMANDLGGEGG